LSAFAPSAIVVLLVRNIALLGFFVLLLLPARAALETATSPIADTLRPPLRQEAAAQ